MEDNINIEIKKVDGVVIFKLLEKSFDASIAGLVKGELTVLLSADDVQKLIFDLSEDISEQKNLFDSEPEITKRLKRNLEAWLAETVAMPNKK